MICFKHEPGDIVYLTNPPIYTCRNCGEEYTQESNDMRARIYTPEELAKLMADMQPQKPKEI